MIHTLDPLSEGNTDTLNPISGGFHISEVSNVEMPFIKPQIFSSVFWKPQFPFSREYFKFTNTFVG